ncbi:MAG: TlpA family protein disulfide reductase [Polyangiaceae bacterium]|nr:TlpA family protein disulfide reductase [Polyangiaceae bacterium]
MPYSAEVVTRLIPWVTAVTLLGCGHSTALDAPAAPDDDPQPVAKSLTQSALAIGPDADKTDVSSAVGKPAPAWETTTWFNSSPLKVEDLRGKVVLVRWFMSSECPYCSATAPSLVELHDAYANKGLTIVGMYHHKSEGPLVEADVKSLVVDHYKFKFPVAIDEDWKTLKSWWLTAHPDSWTSVSFVIDKKGVVRFMHLGGEYPPDSADYKQIEKWIEQLLSEPA